MIEDDLQSRLDALKKWSLMWLLIIKWTKRRSEGSEGKRSCKESKQRTLPPKSSPNKKTRLNPARKTRMSQLLGRSPPSSSFRLRMRTYSTRWSLLFKTRRTSKRSSRRRSWWRRRTCRVRARAVKKDLLSIWSFWWNYKIKGRNFKAIRSRSGLSSACYWESYFTFTVANTGN